MKTLVDKENACTEDDDDDVKVVFPLPESSTSTQLLDPLGNKIGEIELNTYDNFQYATESYISTIDRIVWGEQDTNLLLERYEAYISEVGPRKRFHSKKYMWNQIANDIYAKFKLMLTGVQCENRYKTICKRKKATSENNVRLSNSKNAAPSEEEKSGTIERVGFAENSLETENTRNEALNIEKLEQTNQELTQHIQQFNVRFITLVDKLEKNHNRQQQKLEKLIQENREQHKTEFSTLFEKLDKIHESIQQNHQQQQQMLEKLFTQKDEQHKNDFTKLLDVLERIHKSIKPEEKKEQSNCLVKYEREENLKRLNSRSPSNKRSSRAVSPYSPVRKRHRSSASTSPSTSKCRHQSPTASHTCRRSRSNDKRNSESRSSARNNQCSPHSSRSSKYDRKRKSKSRSRSPKRSNRRSLPEQCYKYRDQYR